MRPTRASTGASSSSRCAVAVARPRLIHPRNPAMSAPAPSCGRSDRHSASARSPRRSSPHVKTDTVGLDHLRVQQTFRGIPVVAAEKMLHFRGADLVAANGKALPDLAVDTMPTVDPEHARRAVRKLARERQGREWKVPQAVDAAGGGAQRAHSLHPASGMTCYACHSAWTTSCFGCHLSMINELLFEIQVQMEQRVQGGRSSAGLTG